MLSHGICKCCSNKLYLASPPYIKRVRWRHRFRSPRSSVFQFAVTNIPLWPLHNEFVISVETVIIQSISSCFDLWSKVIRDCKILLKIDNILVVLPNRKMFYFWTKKSQNQFLFPNLVGIPYTIRAYLLVQIFEKEKKLYSLKSN